MLSISHRGYCREVVENTWEAFEQAQSLGIDGIETDIRLTSDGQLVLFHDRRLADGRAVSDLSHMELCKAMGAQVPALVETLQRFDSLLWVLELKDQSATEPLVHALRPLVANRQLLVISFWHDAMVEVRRQLDIECGVTVAHRPADFSSYPLRPWHTIVWKYEFVDPLLIQQSIAEGHRNFVYDVQGIDEHRRCYELGLDGIISDEPQLVAAGRPAFTSDSPAVPLPLPQAPATQANRPGPITELDSGLA